MSHLSPLLKQATSVVAVRGEGVYLHDADGRRYLDFTAGIGVTSTGHCHPKVVEKVREQIGKLLDDLIGRRNQKRRVRLVGLRIEDEKSACPLANPLHQPAVIGATQQRVNAIQGIGAAAAGGDIRRLRPFVNHGQRQPKLRGHLLGTALLEYIAQNLV